MSIEEHLDRRRRPSLAARPILPVLPVQLAATLALETLKLIIGLHQPTLVDNVLEFDGVTGRSHLHPVLVHPSCPVCSKKKPRYHPGASELIAAIRDPTAQPVDEMADRLVSPRTGIVVDFGAAPHAATEPSQPLVWRAKLANHSYASDVDDSRLLCSGKGTTRAQAWASCLGEALERYSGAWWRADEATFCRRSDLPGRSVDPMDLVLYRPEQYEHLPYAPYDEQTELRWVRGRSLVHHDDVWMPAIAVFMEYQVASEGEFLFPVTSNGLAAGATLADAVLAALYEVLERDAFLIAWLGRLPGRQLEPLEHPDPDIRRLALAYRRRGVELALYELPTDHAVAVVAAVAFQAGGYGGPCATVGLGASLDLTAAGRAAALEVAQVRPGFRARTRTHDASRIAELVADPARTRTLHDHALLYADPSMRSAFRFLEGERGRWPQPRPASTGDALAELLTSLGSDGQDVLYFNLTPPDLEPLRVFTARAIVPGFQPIWFGRGERRLGGRRLYELPHRLGLRDAPMDVASLNPLPHPVA
jgi:ribosomal protein S12 methylthiotransferase accessory factor